MATLDEHSAVDQNHRTISLSSDHVEPKSSLHFAVVAVEYRDMKA